MFLQVQEWYDKASKFGEVAHTVKKLGERLFHVRNRSLLYELYPYVWDMCGVVSLLNSYVKWLGALSLRPACLCVVIYARPGVGIVLVLC